MYAKLLVAVVLRVFSNKSVHHLPDHQVHISQRVVKQRAVSAKQHAAVPIFGDEEDNYMERKNIGT